MGYYGAGNLGDELMLICLQKWLFAQAVDLTIIAENADEVRNKWGFRAIRNYPLLGQFAWVEALVRGKVFRVLKEIAQTDVMLCGGGEILRDGVGWRTFSYQIEKIIFALLLGKPVFLLNVGIPRPVTRYARWALKWLLPRCAGIVVREEKSLNLCREFGAEAVTLFHPDIVLRMPEFFPVPDNVRQGPPTALVALHCNPNVYGGYDLNEGRLGAFAGALDRLVESQGMRIVFMPCQSHDGADDNDIHRAIQSRMRHKDRSVLLEWSADPDRISLQFRNCSLVIAMRLHAAVLAVAFDRACVLLPYDKKVVDFGTQSAIPYWLTADALDSPETAKALLTTAASEKSQPRRPPPNADWILLNLDKIVARSHKVAEPLTPEPLHRHAGQR
jgi:polysaccharide pyruvyl transferase CsaB